MSVFLGPKIAIGCPACLLTYVNPVCSDLMSSVQSIPLCLEDVWLWRGICREGGILGFQN